MTIATIHRQALLLVAVLGAAMALLADNAAAQTEEPLFSASWREVTQEVRMVLDNAGITGCSQVAARRSSGNENEYLIACRSDDTAETNWRVRLTGDPALPVEEAWTALAMARDGGWGAAVDRSKIRARAHALADCRASGPGLGCGATFTTIQGGWTLALRCGDENILAAGKTLAEAERAALEREDGARSHSPNMAACARVLIIDPAGASVAAVPANTNRIAGPWTGSDLYADAPAHETSAAGLAPNVGGTRDSASQLPVRAAKSLAEIATWKTVALGTHHDVNALREALDSNDCGFPDGRGALAAAGKRPSCHLGETAAEIIGRPAFALSKTRIAVDLVIVSASDLGLSERPKISEIYAQAKHLGLELCPAEVGPQLRLQYLDQPIGEFLHVAMLPIATYGGDLVDLTLGNGGAGLLLIGGDGNPELSLDASVKFLFVRPARVAAPNLP